MNQGPLAAMAPGGEQLFVASRDEIVRIDRAGRRDAWPVENTPWMLEAAPDGQHFAYFAGEEFVVAREGTVLWKRRINTDRAAPHAIRFSPSGDAVVTLDDYDGVFRTRLVELPSGTAHEISNSRVRVDWDRVLQHFTVLPIADSEHVVPRSEDFRVLHRGGGSCHPVDTTRVEDPLSRLLVDPQRPIALGLGRQRLWWQRSLGWTMTPLPPALPLDGRRGDLQLADELAFVIGVEGEGAALVTPQGGVVWTTDEIVQWAQLIPRRVLVRLAGGEVLLVSEDGQRLLRWLPPTGAATIACTHVGGDVRVAWIDLRDDSIRLQSLRVPRQFREKLA